MMTTAITSMRCIIGPPPLIARGEASKTDREKHDADCQTQERQQQAETGHCEHHEQQDHQFHHSSPPLTEGCLSIENTASSPLRASTSRINASISSDTMPAPAS